jgi:esterase
MPRPHSPGQRLACLEKMDNMLNGYLQLGHGPRKVLALNGWFGSADDWGPMVDALDLDAFTYVFFDYRGYGRSMHLKGEFTFEEAAQDVLRLADHLQLERFALIGHSMGGAAMQRVLLAAPGRIERMIAITAVPACSSRMDAQRLAMFENAVASIEKREFILNFSTGNRLPNAWSRRMARQSMAASTPAAFAAYLKEWATNDFCELVRDNPAQLKVIVGEHDPTLSAALMQETWLAWYPNASLETLPNSGHYPTHEVPLALAAAVEAFLKQP